ncbi:hypothetical protein NMY22_g4098 [Coprinellus aureogranulatus]|nr:hypothetical protein NMY22_g4098 [Coprinellus aureogranulatus]
MSNDPSSGEDSILSQQQAAFYNSCDPEVTGEGVQWAYSTCTGAKKALLIGINYVGTSSELRGCVNDVLNLRKFITERWGYENENITTVTDDPNVSTIRPTKANIIAQLKELVKGAQQNDALFLCYSGHGTQVQDEDGNEIDGMDEVICPVDYEEEGFIEDDYLKELLVDPLPMGCRLTVIFDVSSLHVPCDFTSSNPSLLPAYPHSAATPVPVWISYTLYVSSPKAPELKPTNSSICIQYSPKGHILNGANPDDPKKSPADIVYLSGCRDDQTSADTVEEGRATGALSHAFVEALTKTPELSYLQMLINTRKILVQKRHTQVPQLSSSHPIDTNLQFII